MIGVMISQANTLDYLHAINLFPKVTPNPCRSLTWRESARRRFAQWRLHHDGLVDMPTMDMMLPLSFMP